MLTYLRSLPGGDLNAHFCLQTTFSELAMHARSISMFRVFLGWLRLEIFIYVKKVLLIRSIAMLSDSIYKRIFRQRLLQFKENITEGRNNDCDSLVYDIINTALLFCLYDDAMGLLCGTRMYSKHQWKTKVCSNAWLIEKQYWNIRTEISE